MALTKVGSGGIENVTNSANATFLTIDASEQITVASEGGAVTTSIQQGIAKAWVGHATDSSQSITGDTFNVSGFTDVATGYSTHTLTNNMNTGASTYPVQCTPASQYGYHGKGDSSSVFQLRCVDSTGNSADGAKNGLVHGDLA